MKTRTLLLAAVLAVPFFAQAQTARMEQRELNQERRIQQGEASGSLTQREAARLELDHLARRNRVAEVFRDFAHGQARRSDGRPAG